MNLNIYKAIVKFICIVSSVVFLSACSSGNSYRLTVDTATVNETSGALLPAEAPVEASRSITDLQTTVTRNTIVNERQNENVRIKRISLSAVGDIMVHRTQLIKADYGGTFDFSESFEYIQSYISASDFAVGNLETTLAGPNGQRRINVEKFYKAYSGYPCFNTPDILATNIKEAGFDFVSTANNHSLDSKEVGVIRTIDVLDEVGLLHTGTYQTEEASKELTLVDVDGITFSFINYTYGLNGFVLDKEDDYMVNHLDMYESSYIEQMNRQVQEATNISDFVVVMLHYGNEYVIEPDRYYQQPIIDGLFEAGADIIFGGHLM